MALYDPDRGLSSGSFGPLYYEFVNGVQTLITDTPVAGAAQPEGPAAALAGLVGIAPAKKAGGSPVLLIAGAVAGGALLLLLLVRLRR